LFHQKVQKPAVYCHPSGFEGYDGSRWIPYFYGFENDLEAFERIEQ